MCRFIAYLGKPIIAEELLIKPENSLINQSYHAKEMDEPLNGDGFGLGWYVKSIRKEPALFNSITPAWNNMNLKYNAGVIQSNCIIAHIRAATEGIISEVNSHPFKYNEYLMMHNGGILNFQKIRRDLLTRLADPFFEWIKGQTDSEHIFALLMQHMTNRRNGKKLPLSAIADCFNQTFTELEDIKRKNDLPEPSVYNTVVTDGDRIIATRYSTDPDKAIRTLYYAYGEKYVCENNVCRMVPGGLKPGSFLVVSEKLDQAADEWIEVPINHCLMIEKDLSFEYRSLD